MEPKEKTLSPTFNHSQPENPLTLLIHEKQSYGEKVQKALDILKRSLKTPFLKDTNFHEKLIEYKLITHIISHELPESQLKELLDRQKNLKDELESYDHISEIERETHIFFEEAFSWYERFVEKLTHSLKENDDFKTIVRFLAYKEIEKMLREISQELPPPLENNIKNNIFKKYEKKWNLQNVTEMNLRIIERWREVLDNNTIETLFGGREWLNKVECEIGEEIFEKLLNLVEPTNHLDIAERIKLGMAILRIKNPELIPWVLINCFAETGFSGELPFIRSSEKNSIFTIFKYPLLWKGVDIGKENAKLLENFGSANNFLTPQYKKNFHQFLFKLLEQEKDPRKQLLCLRALFLVKSPEKLNEDKIEILINLLHGIDEKLEKYRRIASDYILFILNEFNDSEDTLKIVGENLRFFKESRYLEISVFRALSRFFEQPNNKIENLKEAIGEMAFENILRFLNISPEDLENVINLCRTISRLYGATYFPLNTAFLSKHVSLSKIPNVEENLEWFFNKLDLKSFSIPSIIDALGLYLPRKEEFEKLLKEGFPVEAIFKYVFMDRRVADWILEKPEEKIEALFELIRLHREFFDIYLDENLPFFFHLSHVLIKFLNTSEESAKEKLTIALKKAKEDYLKLNSELSDWVKHGVLPPDYIKRHAHELFILCYLGIDAGLNIRKFRRAIERGAPLFTVSLDKLEVLLQLANELHIALDNMTRISSDSLFTLFSWRKEFPQLLPTLREVLNNNPRQFNNLITSLRELLSKGFRLKTETSNEGYNPRKLQERVRELLHHSRIVTPSLLNIFLFEDDPTRRLRIIEQLNSAVENIFRNTPLENVKIPEGFPIEELIAFAFPGVSIEEVRRTLHELEDRTYDLENFNLPENGFYEIELSTQTERRKVLKKGERLDESLFQIFQFWFGIEEKYHTEKPEDDKEIERCISKILRQGGSIQVNDENALRILRAFIIDITQEEGNLDLVRELVKRHDYSSKAELLENMLTVLSKDFDEKFVQWLEERINNTITIRERRINQLQKDLLGKRNLDRETYKLTEALRSLQSTSADTDSSLENERKRAISSVVKFIIKSRILERNKGNGILQGIRKELEKFEYSSTEGLETGGEVRIKGYVTKNLPAFFSSYSADICIKGDPYLYNRKDYFYIVLVDPETNRCIGNIQGYIIEEEGKQALLFRGFNPTNSFLEGKSTSLVVDAMLEIIRRFAKENNIEIVLISEQLGDFHALSNRPPIINDFERRFRNKSLGWQEVLLKEPFPITRYQTIKKAYLFPLQLRATPIS